MRPRFRKTTLAALAMLTAGGIAAGTLAIPASAQQAAPPAASADSAHPHPMHGRWMHDRWMKGHHPRPMMHMLRTWGLFYPAADKHLTRADATQIATGLLLWHGNHSWKVVDVAAAPHNRIGFAFATADGSVIARFTMDRRTG